jgi:Lrp/AsnC family transcriptional regulator for asnA, asnC and gidA
MNQLDPIDIRIVNELTKDARMPYVRLAKKLKVSNSLVHQRIQKMKDAGIISKAVFLLDPLKLGYETYAFTQIMIANAKQHNKIEEELKKIPEIVECTNIAGRYALFVKIYAKNNKHLRDVIYERILTIDGVEGTNTTMSFETAFTRSVPIVLDN